MELQVPENKVEGCVSQVWVKAFLQPDGSVTYSADSDSQLTKGLAALLVRGLSGTQAEEILGLSPSFIEMLGLQQALTPSRNNGFLNMFLKMQKVTLEALTTASSKSEEAGAETKSQEDDEGEGGSPSSNSTMSEKIDERLTANLKPARYPSNQRVQAFQLSAWSD